METSICVCVVCYIYKQTQKITADKGEDDRIMCQQCTDKEPALSKIYLRIALLENQET